MNERWKKAYGRITKDKKYVHFYLEVEAKNGLVVFRRKSIPKSDTRWARLNLYSFILNTMVQEIDHQIGRGDLYSKNPPG